MFESSEQVARILSSNGSPMPNICCPLWKAAHPSSGATKTTGMIVMTGMIVTMTFIVARPFQWMGIWDHLSRGPNWLVDTVLFGFVVCNCEFQADALDWSIPLFIRLGYRHDQIKTLDTAPSILRSVSPWGRDRRDDRRDDRREERRPADRREERRPSDDRRMGVSVAAFQMSRWYAVCWAMIVSGVCFPMPGKKRVHFLFWNDEQWDDSFLWCMTAKWGQ